MEPVTTIIAASAANVVRRRLVQLSGRDDESRVKAGEEGVLTPAVLDEVRSTLGADKTSGRETRQRRSEELDMSSGGEGLAPLSVGPGASTIAAVALSLDPDAVYRDSRSRINAALRLRWALAIVLASVLVVGITGVIATALFASKDTGTIVFGGMAFADVLALVFTRPFKLINEAHLDSIRLEVAFLRLRDQLQHCAKLPDNQQLKCRANAWDRMQDELRALSGDGRSSVEAPAT